MPVSLRAAAALLDPLNPPSSLRGIYARQPWIPVDPSTGMPPFPASAIAILGAIQARQPEANSRLAQLVTAVSGALGDFSTPDSPPQSGPPVPNAPSWSMKSYRRFRTAIGFASVEIWGDAEATRLIEGWVSIPRGGLGGQPDTGLLKDAVLSYPGIYAWYVYEWQEPIGTFAPRNQDLTSSPFPPLSLDERPPRLDASGDWSHRSAYGTLDGVGEWLGTGSDPHWVPILVGEKHDNTNSWIGDIHALMQSPATQAQAVALLNSARPGDDVDLKDRTQNNAWQPVALRGYITSAAWPSGDFGKHHTTSYSQVINTPLIGRVAAAPTGDWADQQYPFAGADWDMEVVPDADVSYLLSRSWLESSWPDGYLITYVRIEIEHFALGSPLRPVGPNLQPYPFGYEPSPVSPGQVPPPAPAQPSPYYPVVGQWVQACGRWVIDTGHPQALDPKSAAYQQMPDAQAAFQAKVRIEDLRDGFYTEIHPPEMMVASSIGLVRVSASMAPEDMRHATVASVCATGASLHDQEFVIHPPYRPSPLAKLNWNTLDANGTIGSYDRQVGGNLELQTTAANDPNHLIGRIVWDGWPDANVSPILLYGSGMVGMTSLRGLQCLVRAWWDVPVSTRGMIRGTLAAPPAGLDPSQAGAPRGVRVFYRNAAFANVFWQAVLSDALGQFTIPDLPSGSYVVQPASGDYVFGAETIDVPPGQVTVTINGVRSVPLGGQLEVAATAAAREVSLLAAGWQARETLIRLSEPAGFWGVSGSGRALMESGTFFVQLAGIAAEDGISVASETDAARMLADDKAVFRRVPVSGARLRVVFWVRRRDVLQPAVIARVTTDAAGYARFELHAGSQTEEGHITVSVVENPLNPWLLASAATRTMIFHPSTAPAVAGAPAQLYRLVAPDEGAEPPGRNLAAAGVLRALHLDADDVTRARLFIERAQRKFAKSMIRAPLQYSDEPHQAKPSR